MPTSLPPAAALIADDHVEYCMSPLSHRPTVLLVDEDERATAFQLSEHNRKSRGGTSRIG